MIFNGAESFVSYRCSTILVYKGLILSMEERFLVVVWPVALLRGDLSFQFNRTLSMDCIHVRVKEKTIIVSKWRSY